MSDEFARPIVSVIIVNWNAREYLLQCLASLNTEASRYSMEIMVVDNASSDDSVDWVKRCYPDVVLIRNVENLGFAKANNLAILASTGRYVCFVNSDVKVLANCITGLVNFCEEHPKVGMVGPRIIGGDGKIAPSCRGFPSVWNMFCRALALDVLFPGNKMFSGYSLAYRAQEGTRSVDILFGCFWLVRRAALTEVGLLDEDFFMYSEDMDWCRRFWAHRWPVVFVPSCEAIHYGGGSSSNSPIRFAIERQKADLLYWRKHHSRLATACYFLISCLHLLLRVAACPIAACFQKSARQNWKNKSKSSLQCLKWLVTAAWATRD